MTTCHKCGYNPDKLTEYMKTVVPKSRIEDLIKHYETTKELHFKEQTIFDLKGLLAEK